MFTEVSLVKLVTRTLVSIDESGSINSELAKSWSIANEGRTYTFKVAKAKFSNGDTVTAHDIALSLSRRLTFRRHKKSGNNLLQQIITGADKTTSGRIPVGIKVLNSNTLEINLNRAYQPFLEELSYPLWGIVKVLPNKTIVTTGDYIYRQNEEEGYFQKINQASSCKPKRIVLSKYNLTTEVVKSLQDGVIDIAIGYHTQKEPDKRYRQLNISGFGFVHYFFNRNSWISKHPKLRIDLKKALRQFNSNFKYSVTSMSDIEGFFPPGIVPFDKKKTSRTKYMDAREFKERWASIIKSRKLHFIGLPFFNDKLYPKKLTKFLRELGFDDAEVEYYRDPVKSENTGKYDLIGLVYSGTSPDPESYLHPLINDSSFKYIMTLDLKNSIDKIRWEDNKYIRLSGYRDALDKFYSRGGFIPIAKIKAPILLRNGLHIDSNDFMYEIDLSSIRTGQ